MISMSTGSNITRFKIGISEFGKNRKTNIKNMRSYTYKKIKKL